MIILKFHRKVFSQIQRPASVSSVSCDDVMRKGQGVIFRENFTQNK